MKSKEKQYRVRVPAFLLTTTQRFRSSWTRWRLKRVSKKRVRAMHRLTLLQLETDHQHLRLKELGQQRHQLEHRLQEMQEATEFRLQQPEQSLRNLLGSPLD